MNKHVNEQKEPTAYEARVMLAPGLFGAMRGGEGRRGQ